MFATFFNEIKRKLNNPLAELSAIDKRRIDQQIIQTNYNRLQYLLYFMWFFSLILILSNFYYFGIWSAKNIIHLFFIADISLFLLVTIGIVIFLRKKTPLIRFQKRIVLFYLFFGAIWIGIISGLDYRQNALTIVAGLFILSGSFLMRGSYHALLLGALYGVYLVLHYPYTGEYHDALTIFFIIPACLILAWVYTRIMYKNKVESLLTENRLRAYSGQLEDVVEKRTAELRQKNENLIREIESKETIQSQLIASEELFKKILYQSVDAIAIFDTGGRILQWNDKAEKYTGIGRKEAYQRIFWELIAQLPEKGKEITNFRNSVDNFVRQISARTNQTEQLRLRHWIVNRSGEQRYLETKIFPIHLYKDMLVAAISRDVTRQYEYESHLKQAREEAENASAAKSDFLANISHDLRSPLNSISGFSQILKLKTDITYDKRKKYLNIIYDNSRYLLQLINALIDLSKIQSGNMKVEKDEFDLDSFLNEVESIIQSEKSLFAPDVELKKKYKHTGLSIISDRTKLLQIFTNLLSNAVKFTRKGHISVYCAVNNQRLEASVEDTGTGMDEQELEHIFDRYYSSASAANQKRKGKGIGLAIVKGYINLLGGEISVQSSKNYGTCFDFSIPVKITNSVISKTETLMPPAGKKVLIVDSDPESAEFLCELMDQYHLQAFSIDNYNQIDDKIAHISPDMLIIDIFRDNGAIKTKLQQIKTVHQHIPVIAITALSQIEVSALYQALVNEVVYKPVNAAVLMHQIAQSLNE